MRTVIGSIQKPTVHIDDIDQSKIYVSNPHGSPYKLQNISSNWMFCSLHDSVCGSTGVHKTIKKAIECELTLGSVYELDSVNELITWLEHNR